MSNKKNDNMLNAYSNEVDFTGHHGRYSYKIFKNLTIENIDFSKTLLNNCSLQNCIIKNCNMDSVDYQGSEFYCCTFENVSFHGADISSCIFKNSCFIKCDFNATNFIDNNIINCTVTSSNFIVSTINNNIWDKCKFLAFVPDDTSMYSNEFYFCIFEDCVLLSSIYYTIFCKCRFYSTQIDSYILGFQYGLRYKDIKSLKIEHFKEKDVSTSFLKKDLSRIYIERQMFLEKKVFDMVFSNNIGKDLEDLVRLLFNYIDNGLIVKIDEARFVRKILDYIYKKKEISLFYYIFIIDELQNKKFFEYKKLLSDNLFCEISILYQLIYSIKMEIESVYIEICDNLLNSKPLLENVTIEFVYKRCPNYRIYEIIEQSSNYNIKPIRESHGSFIEEYLLNNSDILINLAAIATILGVNLYGFLKFICKSINNLIKREKENNKVDDKIVKKESVSEILEVTESNKNISINNGIYREEIYYKTSRTIISHKVEIIQNYDKNNLKKINISKL